MYLHMKMGVCAQLQTFTIHAKIAHPPMLKMEAMIHHTA